MKESEDRQQRIMQARQEMRLLISAGYEKYKSNLSEAERKVVDDFLYYHEFEEALTNLVAILSKHKLVIDEEYRENLREVCERMNIPRPAYLGEES